MNRKLKLWGIGLQMPLLLLVILSFFGSIYAVIKNIGGVNLGVPIILGIIILLYFYGKYLQNNSKDYLA